MPLIVPRLDDRSFDDLVAEMVARIPAHTPEWTDARVGDPGRTLIELFAWLGDTLLYRANLIPERQRLKFLQLLGIPLRPARPARGIVSLRITDEEVTQPRTLLSGAVLSGPVEFETRHELTVLPGQSAVFVKRRPEAGEVEQLDAIVADLKELYELPPGTRADPYLSREVFVAGEPSQEGIDLIAHTVDRSLWLALLAPKPEDVAAMSQSLKNGREGRPFVLSLGVVLPPRPVESFDELPERRRLDFTWELSQATPPGHANAPPRFQTLEVLYDGTGGFLRDGVMQVQLTPGELGAPSNDVRQALHAGVGDQRPPRLDDPQLAERLVAWLRLRPTERLESLRVSWLGLNAAEVVQGRTYQRLVVGEGRGMADQQTRLPVADIDPSSFALELAEAGATPGQRRYRAWQRREDLASSGPDDRHYVLDPEAGTLTFGDGMRGRVPGRGESIRVQQMRAGGGPAGNLPPGSLAAVGEGRMPDGAPLDAIEVLQTMPLRGGVAAETLVEAERRIPAWLRHRGRAVTEADYRALASTTPGTSVARVELLPRFKPHQRLSGVPGVLTVMVIPTPTRLFEAPNPRADRPTLEAVYEWLNARQTLGTELYMVSPEYVPLAVSVAVQLRDGAEREATLFAVRRAVGAFLWPLPPGGAVGTGWPLGGRVVDREVEVAVARVSGVASVSDVRLFERDSEGWALLPQTGPDKPQVLTLDAWQLPELAAVLVVVGDSASDDPSRLPDPYAGGGDTAIAVPVVPEVC